MKGLAPLVVKNNWKGYLFLDKQIKKRVTYLGKFISIITNNQTKIVLFFYFFLNDILSRPTFIQIWKKKAVEQYSPVPYLATLVNCMMWSLYGLPIVHPDSLLVVTINGTGTGIEIVYIIIFLIYSAERRKRLRVLLVLLIEAIFITVLTVLVLTVARTHKERSMIVGIMCIMFNIMMYASPLAVMVSL